MVTEKDMLVFTGASVFYDALSGLIPCKITAVRGGTGEPERCTSRIRCDAEVTKEHGAFPRGYKFENIPSYLFVPHGCVLKRKHTTVILSCYYVKSDKPKGETP